MSLCIGCGASLPEYSFGRPRQYCDDCRKAANKRKWHRHYDKDPERASEISKRSYQKHRTARNEHNRQNWPKYAPAINEKKRAHRHVALEEQGVGTCQGCGSPLAFRRRTKKYCDECNLERNRIRSRERQQALRARRHASSALGSLTPDEWEEQMVEFLASQE